MDSRFYATLDGVVRAGFRFERLPFQLHARLGKRLAALAMVAGAAGRDQIFPGMRTALGARDECGRASDRSVRRPQYWQV